jgi:hypothetical protein
MKKMKREQLEVNFREDQVILTDSQWNKNKDIWNR